MLTLTELTDSGFYTLYPVNILSDLPIGEGMELDSRILTYPIHIHTPHTHIDTIHGSTPNQRISALDLLHFLQTIARRPLDFYTIYSQIYSQLSQRMKVETKAAFMRRNGQSSSSTIVWEAYTSGWPTRGGPIGENLLLGNVNI